MQIGSPPIRRKPSLTPMIDVVFLLLVFFMLAARFGQDVVIDLPISAASDKPYEGPPRLIDVLPDTSAAALQQYDRTWWREYKTMYRFLRWLQKWGYGNERQMEVFTDMCRNKDVQQLTFESYMFKRMTPVPWLSQMRMTGDILASQVRHYLPYAGARA